MTTLTDFLLARIAEDEAAARAAQIDSGLIDASIRAHNAAQGRAADAAHIARHDPARVLAECEAKRRIVAATSAWRHEVVEDCWYTCAAATEAHDGGECCDDARRGTGCDCGLAFRVSSVLKPLALPYASHPDYLEKWRP